MCSSVQQLQEYAAMVLYSGPSEDESDAPVVLTLGHAVKRVVESFIGQGWTFTAYNVTRSLRETFPLETNGVYIEHEPVRELVHAAFETALMPGYERYTEIGLADSPLAFRLCGDASRTFPPNQALIEALASVQASIQPATVLADPNDPTGGTAPPVRAIVGLLLSATSFSS